MSRLLIVDDDAHIAASLAERFQARGHMVATASNGREGLARIRKDAPDVVLLDLQMPEMDGFELLKKLREEGLETTVIVVTAFGTVEKAVQALREGAYDMLQKPFEPSLVEETVKRALERTSLKRMERVARVEIPPIIVTDARMKEVVELARKAARSESTILLLGESGTGKEVLARNVHLWSPRATGPFVAVNCVALNENLLESELFGHEKGAFTGALNRRTGKIELAHGGTLFLDEIGDISPSFQAKLLRVLQERSFERVGANESIAVDVRVIAATNRDLKKAVADGKFREDLYYRLNVISVAIPALRDRRADVSSLADHFAGVRKKISAEARKALEVYGWPGNVRELKNAIERAMALCDGAEIGVGDLPGEVGEAPGAGPAGGFHDKVEAERKRIVQEALAACGGNQTKAAELLGLQRTYLARLIKQMGL
jgi:DNA-binding NtrC family response regulator